MTVKEACAKARHLVREGYDEIRVCVLLSDGTSYRYYREGRRIRRAEETDWPYPRPVITEWDCPFVLELPVDWEPREP
jgi:hypothetical protein